MDNFHLKEYVMDTNKINYIIAAFAADYQANDEQKLTEAFKTEIETLKVEFESEIDSLRSG